MINTSIFRLKYICVKRITSYWKRFDILFSIFALHEKKLLDENMKIARDFTVNVIENRRKFLLQQNRTNNNEDEISKGMCFVDMLLQSTVDDQSLSDQDILDQMHTFMIAVSLQIQFQNKEKQSKAKIIFIKGSRYVLSNDFGSIIFSIAK